MKRRMPAPVRARAFAWRSRRWPTLPRSLERSTIGAVGLNDRVRNGNGCGPYALTASSSYVKSVDKVDVSVPPNAVHSSLRALRVDFRVVKPHGRLGPLRLEWVAPRPRAAYRRDGLSRPFRGLEDLGRFILGRASHLDAFSGYHSRPSLPGVALGRTTGTRAGRPTRSSRTRVRSPQLSNAHDGYRPNCLTTF